MLAKVNKKLLEVLCFRSAVLNQIFKLGNLYFGYLSGLEGLVSVIGLNLGRR